VGKIIYPDFEAGVNFTNILQAAFTGADTKSAKKYCQVVSLFCAFGIYVCKIST